MIVEILCQPTEQMRKLSLGATHQRPICWQSGLHVARSTAEGWAALAPSRASLKYWMASPTSDLLDPRLLLTRSQVIFAHFRAQLVLTATCCLLTKKEFFFLQSHFLYWKYFSTDPVRHQRQSFSSLAEGRFDCFGRRRAWQHIRVQGELHVLTQTIPGFLGLDLRAGVQPSSRSQLDPAAELVFWEPVFAWIAHLALQGVLRVK